MDNKVPWPLQLSGNCKAYITESVTGDSSTARAASVAAAAISEVMYRHHYVTVALDAQQRLQSVQDACWTGESLVAPAVVMYICINRCR